MMNMNPSRWSMTLAGAISAIIPSAGCTTVPDGQTDGATWSSGLTVSQVDVSEIGGVMLRSCARLSARWDAVPETIDRVSLTVTDQSSSLSWTEIATPGATSFELSNLKSATRYTISIQGCEADDCEAGPSGGEAEGETAEEVWQLLGTGDSLDGLVNIVSDSNAKAHAFVYGESAPADMRGRIQLYYGAMGGYGGSLSVATSNRVADPADETSYSDFSSFVGTSGLVQPEAPSSLVEWIGTGQAVPLSRNAGGGVRLFFEARGADGKTRIMSLDSQDGDVGRDFNSGPAAFCSLAVDYETGGGCHPTVEIGVEGDAVAAASGIANARQQKVGVATLSDWRWDGAAGSFMVFTTGAIDGCSSSKKNHGYAVYDGSSWAVQYTDASCPKLFTGVQAMAPLDLGDHHFKIQFGNPDETDGSLGGKLPFLGPKRLIYGDAARSGDPQVLEFEDWDGVEDAREITFLWPSGTVLDATAEGYIDDFVLLTPTFDLEHQIQFIVLTDGEKIPFTSVAVLRNR